MKKLLKYLKDYKLESVMGPLFKMLEASFELFVPLVMANIIDTGIKNADPAGGNWSDLFSDGSVFLRQSGCWIWNGSEK